MEPIEIITILGGVLVVGGVIGRYVYRKVKKLPTGECASCIDKNQSLFKAYYKKYPKAKKNKKSA